MICSNSYTYTETFSNVIHPPKVCLVSKVLPSLLTPDEQSISNPLIVQLFYFIFCVVLNFELWRLAHQLIK